MFNGGVMKKKSRKYLFALAALSALMFAPGASAKINPLAFKGVTKHFKAGKKFLSPVLGATGLDIGLINNLRLYGNFTPTYLGGKRIYIEDESKDPLWNMVKIFFPSSGGALSSESTRDANFGKNVTDPRTIALLLNFTNDLREGKTVDDNKLKREIFESLKKDFKDKDEEIVKNDLQSSISTFTIEKGQEFKLLGKIKKLFTLKGKLEFWDIFSLDITNITNDKKKTLEKKLKEIQSLIETFFEGKVNERKTKFQNEFEAKTLTPLIDSIQQSIKNEPDSLYPVHTTEQVISSFFCNKFNTQQDIWELLKNMDDAIVDKINLPTEEDYLREDDRRHFPKYSILVDCRF